MRRRLSKGLSANLNYQYAIERGSAFDGFSFGRTMVDQGNVRHAFKTQWDWTIPVGRGQRFGANLNPILEGIVGGWSLNGVGRVQARTLNLGQRAARRHDGGRADGPLQIRGPAERIRRPDGVRAARRHHPQHASGVEHQLHVRDRLLDEPRCSRGKYIAPPNSADCIQVRAGDCAPRTVIIRTPFFTRFDIGVTKKFALKGRTNFEVRLDMLNLFDNINFDPVDLDDNAAGVCDVGEPVPGDDRLSRSEQHLRPGRPPRPADVPHQLVVQ